ncbi:MAG: hypothetical protein GTN80_02395 [Nitrososphaeria archaeon]|nr:hypothetical protein [Nitrososphaeria archaeon]NIN52026.1 hypothetical protein [Nitrososphaeria archaeon]NIQ32488.1 hypothetical protein [Nitrososphaeria archaeon]
MGYRIRVVKRPEILTPSHFLRYILRTELQVEVARSLLSVMDKEGWDSRQWQIFCEEHNMKPGIYSKVLKQLRTAGLIEKRHLRYYLSKDFVIALRKLADYWETVVNMNRRGEEIGF